VGIIGVVFTLAASAAAAPAEQYVLKHPRHEHCKAHYVKKVEQVKVRVHHKTVRVKETVCVYVAPKVNVITPPPRPKAPPLVAAPLTPITPPSTPAPAIPEPAVTLRAHLDPSFVQSPSNPLAVTYSYSASATQAGNGSPEPNLPAGVLNLYSEGLLKCSINVGGSTTGGECPVTYSEYGVHTVVAEYLSGTTNATTGNETERIEPPAATVQRTWSAGAASMVITKDVAQVTLSAASFDGASAVGLADNLGDTCVATVSGSQATCAMTVSGEPSGLTVNYPGGTTTRHIEAFAPGGEREVTEEWPAESVPVIPSVTVYHATISWSGWTKGTSGKAEDSGRGSPPEPVHLLVGERLILDLTTLGNYPGDEAPLGSGAFIVEGGAYTAENGWETDGGPDGEWGSANCSAVHNYSGQAEARCVLTFTEAGTYAIHTAYDSSDPNYLGASGPSATVEVTG